MGQQIRLFKHAIYQYLHISIRASRAIYIASMQRPMQLPKKEIAFTEWQRGKFNSSLGAFIKSLNNLHSRARKSLG